MTQQYDNTNRGVLFKNDRKESESHPDYKGNVNVNGVEFWLSAWMKEGAKGKFMSLSVQPKNAAPAPAPAQRQAPAPRPAAQPAAAQAPARSSGFDDMDSDIPF